MPWIKWPHSRRLNRSTSTSTCVAVVDRVGIDLAYLCTCELSRPRRNWPCIPVYLWVVGYIATAYFISVVKKDTREGFASISLILMRLALSPTISPTWLSHTTISISLIKIKTLQLQHDLLLLRHVITWRLYHVTYEQTVTSQEWGDQTSKM